MLVEYFYDKLASMCTQINKDPEIDDLGVWEYIILLEYWTVHQFDFTAKQDILHHDLSHFEQIVLPFVWEFLFES